MATVLQKQNVMKSDKAEVFKHAKPGALVHLSNVPTLSVSRRKVTEEKPIVTRRQVAPIPCATTVVQKQVNEQDLKVCKKDPKETDGKVNCAVEKITMTKEVSAPVMCKVELVETQNEREEVVVTSGGTTQVLETRPSILTEYVVYDPEVDEKNVPVVHVGPLSEADVRGATIVKNPIVHIGGKGTAAAETKKEQETDTKKPVVATRRKSARSGGGSKKEITEAEETTTVAKETPPPNVVSTCGFPTKMEQIQLNGHIHNKVLKTCRNGARSGGSNKRCRVHCEKAMPKSMVILREGGGTATTTIKTTTADSKMVSVSAPDSETPTTGKSTTRKGGLDTPIATGVNSHIHDKLPASKGKDEIDIVRVIDAKTRDVLVPVPKTENIQELAKTGTISDEFIEHPRERFHFTGCDAPASALTNRAYFDTLGDILRGFNDEFRAELSVTEPTPAGVNGQWPRESDLTDPVYFPLGLHIRPPVADDRFDTETIREANLSAIVQHFTVVLHNTYFKRGAHLQELARFYRQADPGLLKAAFGVINTAKDFSNPISYHFAPAVQIPELMLVSLLQTLIVTLWKKMDLYDLDLKLWVAFPNTVGTLQAHLLALLERLQNQTGRALDTTAFFKGINGTESFENVNVLHKLYPLMFPRLVMYILFYNLGNSAYPNTQRAKEEDGKTVLEKRKRPTVPKSVSAKQAQKKSVRLRVSAQDQKMVTISNGNFTSVSADIVRAPAKVEEEIVESHTETEPSLTLYNRNDKFSEIGDFPASQFYIV